MFLAVLSEEYPYFPLAYLAYTLNLYKLKDSRFNAELRRASVCLPDRTQLFYLLESDYFTPEKIRNIEGYEPKEISSVQLIDSFLQEKTTGESAVVITTDYLSYLFSEESGKEEEAVPPMRHQSRIDRFISADEEKPIRIELKNVPEPDEVEEDYFLGEEPQKDEFLSESLAKIYIKQRKYDRALKIIRELNLLYPEKNRYFADQIRFLEKLIINTNKIT